MPINYRNALKRLALTKWQTFRRRIRKKVQVDIAKDTVSRRQLMFCFLLLPKRLSIQLDALNKFKVIVNYRKIDKAQQC